ncbi:Ribose import permease protein RbsC [subsurface metagenome]
MKISADEIGQILRRLLYKSVGIFTVLIGLVIIFTILGPGTVFIEEGNIYTLLRLGPELAIVTVGMGVLLIAGEFDLSVGGELALCSLVAAMFFTNFGLHPIIGLFAALAFGACLGVINGLIVTKLHISSLIVTLGMMYVFSGLRTALTGGYHTTYHPEMASPAFQSALIGNIGPIPVQIFWLIGITIILYLLVGHTQFGNWIYATGSNKDSARMMGINTNRVKIICFAIVGVLSGFVGVMQSTRIMGSFPVQGTGLNLDAIAGAVVGGISIYGGTGSVWGAMIGSIIIRVLQSGLIIIGIPAFWFKVSLGMMIITAVAFNIYLRKSKDLQKL